MSSRPLIWSFVQQIGRQFASYFVFMALAALLPPKDFGVLGVATAWLAFMAVFSELGFSVALIQKKDITSSHYSSTFFLNILMGVVLTALGMALAWPAARVLGIPESAPVILALSVNFLINSFSLTQSAAAQKAMRFKDLAKRDILASVGGGLVGIALAWRGAGIWSLVAQTLAGSLFGTLLLWRYSDFRPRFSEVSRERIGELWAYSSSMFFYNFFKFLVQNADRLLVGFFLGAEAVGLYTFANKIVLMPAASVRGALGAYLFPLFSRHQSDPGKVRKDYLDVNQALNLLPIPALLVAGALMPFLVPLLFRHKWDAAIPLIQVFTLVGAMQFILAPVGELMKALGRPKWLLYWSVGFSALTIALLTLGCRWNITMVGWAFALGHLLVLPVNFAIARMLVPVSRADLGRIFWSFPLFSLPVIGMAAWAQRTGGNGLPLSASAGIATFLAILGCGLVLANRSFLAGLMNARAANGPVAMAPAAAPGD